MRQTDLPDLPLVEGINCPSCGYYESFQVAKKSIFNQDFSVQQCRVCNHGFVNPYPAIELLAKLSPDYGLGHTTDLNNPVVNNHFDHLFTQYLNRHFTKQEKSMLYVGNGKPSAFEAIAKKHGWASTPILFTDLADALTKLKKGEASSNLLAELEKKFDLIVLYFVLEHFIDPVLAIQQLSKLLKDKGCVFIVVPNIDCDEFRDRKNTWQYIQIPYHINYFNSFGLDTLMTKRLGDKGIKFEKLFQTTFPPPSKKEGETISSLYRLIS